MGVLQACLSDVLPPVRVAQVTVRTGRAMRKESAPSAQFSSDKGIARRAMGEEWAVVQRAIAGDARAQERLFARHTSRLHRTALALLRNKEDAEDAVQDGLCKAYTNLQSFQGLSSFATWLTRIVMNSALMTLRRKRIHPETSLDEILEAQSWLPRGVVNPRPDPEKLCAAAQIDELVEQHVSQLPASLRAAFRLGVQGGLSAAESSQTLGISVSAFKSRIFWARRTVICGLQRSLKTGPSPRTFRRRGRRTVNHAPVQGRPGRHSAPHI
jgi:RNA polymerase sigma factor (sigma-70 family)